VGGSSGGAHGDERAGAGSVEERGIEIRRENERESGRRMDRREGGCEVGFLMMKCGMDILDYLHEWRDESCPLGLLGMHRSLRIWQLTFLNENL
jgi:hypothetical protein